LQARERPIREAGSVAGIGPCVTGSIGANTSEQNYNTTLFAGAQENGVAGTPYSTYNQTTAEAGTLTDSTNGVTFSMINDSTVSGASENYWSLTQPNPVSNQTLVIPIGVFAVTDVWTMIDTELVNSGVNASRVIFNFGTSSNQTSGLDSITVKLAESLNSSTPSGEAQNSVDCVPPSCNGLANGPTLGSATVSGVNVVTGNVYTSAYNNSSAGSSYGPAGNVVLDDQGFFFNNLALTTGLEAGDTNLNTYLVSITVMETGAIGTSAALSAVTLDTAPEPSTVLMLLSGLGAIGLARFRRRK